MRANNIYFVYLYAQIGGQRAANHNMLEYIRLETQDSPLWNHFYGLHVSDMELIQ